jgi:uncharacterized protein (DUF885 family)
VPESTAAAQPDGAAASRDAALDALGAQYWTLALEASPLSATLLGVHDHDDRLDDLSAEVEAEHRNRLAELQQATEALDPASLSAADRITRSLLLHQLSTGIRAADLRLVEMSSDQMDGPHAALLMMAPQLTYPEPAHAEAALTRYAQVPRLLGQALDRFRAGLAAGRTPAAVVIGRSINSLDQYLASPVEADPFLAAGLPEDWSGADAWSDEVLELVRDRIRPAFTMYRDVLRDELAPVARPDDRAGWCWLPDGDELYEALIRSHTTVATPATELHELGVRLTEHELPAEYRRVAARWVADGGPSDLDPDDLGAIFARLRNDPTLRHRDAAEIVELAERTVARATAAMPDWFGRLPTAPCAVAPVPDFLAADAPYAYYFPPAIDRTRPGTYFINTADPEHSSRTEAESIAFHEAIPGHHLQIAISQELEDLPDFQRHDGATSYIEGWGLYAERLADEMGLYSDDVALLGMLTADSWRSARLVVDTGLHASGWSRQQALDYFEQHTPVPVDQVAGEVDRYLAIPGQALSYKVGQLEIQRLRAVAEERLGDAFDVRAFHDVVLGSGAVTLPVLEQMVLDWVEQP